MEKEIKYIDELKIDDESYYIKAKNEGDFIHVDERGVPNGVATLDENGKVSKEQLDMDIVSSEFIQSLFNGKDPLPLPGMDYRAVKLSMPPVTKTEMATNESFEVKEIGQE